MPLRDDDVFRAVSDPTRRQILARLAESPSGVPIKVIAEAFPATRQAVTKHLDVLENAGLIRTRKQGRERVCEPPLAQLQCIYEWVEFYRQFWEDRLLGLGRYLGRSDPT